MTYILEQVLNEIKTGVKQYEDANRTHFKLGAVDSLSMLTIEVSVNFGAILYEYEPTSDEPFSLYISINQYSFDFSVIDLPTLMNGLNKEILIDAVFIDFLCEIKSKIDFEILCGDICEIINIKRILTMSIRGLVYQNERVYLDNIDNRTLRNLFFETQVNSDGSIRHHKQCIVTFGKAVKINLEGAFFNVAKWDDVAVVLSTDRITDCVIRCYDTQEENFKAISSNTSNFQLTTYYEPNFIKQYLTVCSYWGVCLLKFEENIF
ncbi:hypothetical protein AOC36_01870 [Erysipelothrix larvae]|uniref:Uncharacterized protein n=1 Tax=Erysipelothrix larvae TaxID=1514105 RepID=A0A109UGK0_9FIRM|nr:hypothetical protein [Erysipelothrix larvae]AMC92775.1 hypothetical protein AOC36_01870 [Erysipelothrix larvae]